MKRILAPGTSAQGVTLKRYRFPHFAAGLGLLASVSLCKYVVAGYYYRYLVYVHLTRGRHKTEKYEEGVMQVTAETFTTWTNEVPEKVMNRSDCKNEVRTDPAAFCAMWYINEARYLWEKPRKMKG